MSFIQQMPVRWLVVLCLLGGCGAPASPVKPVAAPMPPPMQPTASTEGALPKSVEVKPDEFPNIPAALTELKRATQLPGGAEQNMAIQRCEKWLLLQPEKGVAELAAATKEESAPLEFRLTACRILAQCGATATRPLCEIAIEAEAKPLRLRAMDRLVRIKPAPPEVVQTFITLLDTTDPDILVQTLYNLAKIGEPAAAVADQLQVLRQKHPNESVRVAAGDALKKVSPRRTFQDK